MNSLFKASSLLFDQTSNRSLCLGFLTLFFLHLNKVDAGEIALTFDDAPKPDSTLMTGQERTDLLINNLASVGVNEVWFLVTTQNINEQSRGRLKRYSDAGHKLANHSHSHRSANKTAVSTFLDDVQHAKSILSDFDSVQPFFRFPFLHYGNDAESITALQSGLQAMGYQNAYVTVDNYDWYIDSLLNKAKEQGRQIDWQAAERLYVDVLWQAIRFYDKLAIDTLGRSPRHVLLLHENDSAALFIPALVKRIEAEGWQIISPTKAYQDPIADSGLVTHLPSVLFHKQGRVAALAREAGRSIDELRAGNENMEALNALFDKYRVLKPSVSMITSSEAINVVDKP
ncbi:polysaccharide deacetylase family protein [Agaribacterium sp. ZY112]|uniref:polysaccharide deacetylase family protein n=1 Tax=Agaribacterium sp. ZY112 TaxID=3233574 RepID=UPI0035253E97